MSGDEFNTNDYKARRKLANEIMNLEKYPRGTIFYKFRCNPDNNFCLELDGEEIKLLIEHKKNRLEEIESQYSDTKMTAIEFFKKLREICNARCNELTCEGSCPFPWQFCDLDKQFYKMTDEDIQKIVENVKKFEIPHEESGSYIKEINRFYFEDRTPEETLEVKQNVENALSDATRRNAIFKELFSHFNSHHSNILKSYEKLSDEQLKEKLEKSIKIIGDYLSYGVKPIYYSSEELAIFCMMIDKKWDYLNELLKS